MCVMEFIGGTSRMCKSAYFVSLQFAYMYMYVQVRFLEAIKVYIFKSQT